MAWRHVTWVVAGSLVLWGLVPDGTGHVGRTVWDATAMKQQVMPPVLPRRRRRVRRRRMRRAVAPTSETWWLAKLIQAEAGDQPWRTKVAVADVVLNRVRSGQFPDTVPAVILQPGQFSTVATGAFVAAQPSLEDWRAAQAAIQGLSVVPGALYFYSAGANTAWTARLTGCTSVGAMVFCVATDGP
jgi:spore germination cell wall hydrolase CwlJ-like protein